MKQKMLSVLIITVLLIAAVTPVSFAEELDTSSFFIDFFGEEWREATLSGTKDTSHPSYQVGDAVYTMGDVIITGITDMNEHGLVCENNKCAYVLATMSVVPAEGANVQLVPSTGYATTDLWEIANLPTMPFDSLPRVEATAQEIAAATDAKVLNIWGNINGLVDENRQLLSGSSGFTHWKQPDGSVLIAMEFMLDTPIPLQDSYSMSIHIANWETTPEGKTLWEGHPKENWVFTIAPTKAE